MESLWGRPRKMIHHLTISSNFWVFNIILDVYRGYPLIYAISIQTMILLMWSSGGSSCIKHWGGHERKDVEHRSTEP